MASEHVGTCNEDRCPRAVRLSCVACLNMMIRTLWTSLKNASRNFLNEFDSGGDAMLDRRPLRARFTSRNRETGLLRRRKVHRSRGGHQRSGCRQGTRHSRLDPHCKTARGHIDRRRRTAGNARTNGSRFNNDGSFAIGIVAARCEQQSDRRDYDGHLSPGAEPFQGWSSLQKSSVVHDEASELRARREFEPLLKPGERGLS